MALAVRPRIRRSSSWSTALTQCCLGLAGWFLALTAGVVPARAYQIWAETSAGNINGTNSTVAEYISATHNVEPAHGGYIQRFSSVHGGRGELFIQAGRYSPNPALDTSTQQLRAAAATLRARLRVQNYQDLPGDTVTLVVRFALGSLHAFHGRSTEAGIIGPPPGASTAYARLTARVSLGLGTSHSGHAFATVRNNGRGGYTSDSSSGGLPFEREVVAGPRMLEIQLQVTKEYLAAAASEWNILASLHGEHFAAGSDYYMEIIGGGTVWVGVQSGAGWVSTPSNSPFLRGHRGEMRLQFVPASDDLEVSGFPGQVFQIQDTGALGLPWNPAGQVTIGPNGTAQVSLPRLGDPARFFQLITAP